MDQSQIIKSSQEQATAAWVNQLNQIRLDELLETLSAQDNNLEGALKELSELKSFIGDPAHILGSTKTKHGEIAEHVQVNFSNARRLIEGLAPKYTFQGVGRTAAEDYLKDGLPVQSKFYTGYNITQPQFYNGIINTLDKGVREHLSKYPDFVKNGGTYDIPADYYNEVILLRYLRDLNPGALTKTDLKILKKVELFEKETGLFLGREIQPAVVGYKDVQQGKIHEIIAKEEKSIKTKDQEMRNAAHQKSKPTYKEARYATAVSAGIEGGMSFCLSIYKKRSAGKKFHEFSSTDWKDVGIDTAKGTVTGGIRGASIYVMTNFTVTPAPVASALCTAMFGVVEQANQFRQGNISETEFLLNSETICLDVSISAVASLLGQTAIPIPVLGAVIGNAVGTFMYGIAKEKLSHKEQALIAKYCEDIQKLNHYLDIRYKKLIDQLQAEFRKYVSIVELAFDPDINKAFQGSIALANYVGVSEQLILKNKKDIDNYFLN